MINVITEKVWIAMGTRNKEIHLYQIKLSYFLSGCLRINHHHEQHGEYPDQEVHDQPTTLPENATVPKTEIHEKPPKMHKTR